MHHRLKSQPKYKIGEEVAVPIKTKSDKLNFVFTNEVKGWIMGIIASGTSEKDTYVYKITIDMPGCYHNGEQPFAEVYEDNIVLTNKS